ncbi:hypothetical protein DFA_05133 [Cavenderia fasciculata]|uniref:Uncharacterized protein n=1 Tax=Cavenderia fasciculata TaxID=261658 RepID=F4PNF0_CACFS|nr:uncharacterized protein DFA_05133 [Cavenderia fasciculata]EGG23003.1 hypothetical protein DFA_05133 [Cavenderia fasciculata]|eukprot:XP_004360854.1 hypothetical protein DFA_05133 [Cavenderia fasciculata]
MITSSSSSSDSSSNKVLSLESISIVVTFAEYLDALFKASLGSPLFFSLRSNVNTRLSCQDSSSMECIRQRADQVILHIFYNACNLKDNEKDNGDLIYNQDKCIRPAQALHYLLLIKSPDGTDNDKCLLPYLSYETKKHIHELLLNHIKQLKEFVQNDMELIQLMLFNQYNNDEDIYLFIIQTFNWFNTLFSKEKLVKLWSKNQQEHYGSIITYILYGILKMNHYDAHIREKYLDVIYDTLDTVYRAYSHSYRDIPKSICDNYVHMFLLVLKQYGFQDQRGKQLKRSISGAVFDLFSKTDWNGQIACDFFKEYITTLFLDAYKDDYFIPQKPNDYMNVEEWKIYYQTRTQQRLLIASRIRFFSANRHQNILSILFEHFSQCLTQTWKDKLIVIKLLNMFDPSNMPDQKGQECKWSRYFSIDFLKKVISETLKEDNILVQCELVEFIRRFCDIPYYRKMFVDSIEFRDLIKEAFNNIIDQASPSPHPRLLMFLIVVCDTEARGSNFLAKQIKQIFEAEPLWQEYIIKLVLKSIESDQEVLITDALGFLLRDPNFESRFSSLKQLSRAVIGLLDSYQDDDVILEHVIMFFNSIHKLGFKETNQLIQRILFSKQFEPDQINQFVDENLIVWMGKRANNFSIYLPTVMKIMLDQPTIDFKWVSSIFKRSHQETNRYVKHFVTPIIQLYTNTHIKFGKVQISIAELLKLLFTRTVEYKGIHHQESTRLFQQILDTFTAPAPSDQSLSEFQLKEYLTTHLTVVTEIVEQIIDQGGNITTDQIVQIIDLIVQAQQLIYSRSDKYQQYECHYPQIADLIATLVEMNDDQYNTIEMISSRVIDKTVDWINQNKELSNHPGSPFLVELVLDFYDYSKIIPPTINKNHRQIKKIKWNL